MDAHAIESISSAISYVEAHLHEKPDLSAVADAVGYSRYHLHRMFTRAVGLTLHDYIRRRQLTEAARRLAFSPTPILDIALTAGYESQQAFAKVFKSMYKQTPMEYRQGGAFYPLQLAFSLTAHPSAPASIAYATLEDLAGWRDFLAPVIDGFPGLEEASHLEQVRQSILRRQALVMRDGTAIVGAAAFSAREGRVDFLASHPQYRPYGVTRALLDFMRRGIFPGRTISITTFREGDRADTGQRAEYKRLGFADAEPLFEFGYPVQRLILPPPQGEDHNV